MFYVYILRSLNNGTYYTGQTQDLRKRLTEHRQGASHSAKSMGPFELVYYEMCDSRSQAMRRERFMKTGHGRQERVRLIKDFADPEFEAYRRLLGP